MNENGLVGSKGRASLPMPFRGIIPPLITPLTEERELDADGLRRLVQHVVSGGVHGLFVLGSTGESPSLDSNTRHAVIDVVCASTNGRLPVVVNISDTCRQVSQELAQHAEECGAAGFAICPPYYFPLEQDELTRYVTDLAATLDLPLFIYNIPQFAHSEFTPGTIAQLSSFPNIVGLKNSNGSVGYQRQVRQLTKRENFSLLVGSEEILAEGIQAGAHGGVCGGANMFPQLYVQLYEAAAHGRHAEAEELQTLVRRIADAVYRIGPKGTAYLRGLKYALSLLGLSGETPAEPLEKFNAAERSQLRKRFEEVLPLARQVERT